MTYPTLEDLKRPNLPVTIELPNSEGGVTTYQIPLRMPSLWRIQEIITSIPDPTPPLDEKNPYSRVNGMVRPAYDYNAPSYLAARDMKLMERNHLLLLEAWDEEKLPLPGNTQAEKLEYLKTEVDAVIVRQLIQVMTLYSMKGRAEIDHKAASFRAGTSDHSNITGEEGVELELLEKPAG